MKLKDFGVANGQRVLAFYCPGCKTQHPYQVPRWTWNGSMDSPTFTPSLLCNQHKPELRCHLFVTDGKIRFCDDCWHGLKGQTVDIPEYEDIERFEDEARALVERAKEEV